ncbi:MAG: REP-associated tyrosine transposase [Panacagrimonas sp.]
MRYRRAHVPGATYFFTVVCRDRAPHFADAHLVSRLGQALRHVRASRPFTVDALVVLPDHLHALWTLPLDDGDFSTRWRLVKHFVQLGADQPLWQPRFWEHLIRDEQDFERHFDYIHANPARHGLVSAPRDWPHSTFHRYVRDEVYAADWCDMSGELDRE